MLAGVRYEKIQTVSRWLRPGLFLTWVTKSSLVLFTKWQESDIFTSPNSEDVSKKCLTWTHPLSWNVPKSVINCYRMTLVGPFYVSSLWNEGEKTNLGWKQSKLLTCTKIRHFIAVHVLSCGKVETRKGDDLLKQAWSRHRGLSSLIKADLCDKIRYIHK